MVAARISPTYLLHNEGLSLPRVGWLRLRPLRGQPRHEVRVGGQLGVDQVELLAGLRLPPLLDVVCHHLPLVVEQGQPGHQHHQHQHHDNDHSLETEQTVSESLEQNSKF